MFLGNGFSMFFFYGAGSSLGRRWLIEWMAGAGMWPLTGHYVLGGRREGYDPVLWSGYQERELYFQCSPSFLSGAVAFIMVPWSFDGIVSERGLAWYCSSGYVSCI
jgi:hypothetical protein